MRGDSNVVFSEERRQRIARLVSDHKRVTVSELCAMFNVSAATVRSDLRDMQEAGLLTRTHGGAIPRSRTADEQDSQQKRVHCVPEKQRIARAAAAMVEDGDTLLLDTGTTTFELARQLSSRQGLKIVTNDLEIALMLEKSPTTEVIVLGGILRSGFHCTIGRFGTVSMADLRVDKAFMGTNAFSLEAGATTPSVHHSETKRAMMSMANQSILLCDNSKIGRVTFARFASAADFDVLICDSIDSRLASQLRDLGVDVVVTE